MNRIIKECEDNTINIPKSMFHIYYDNKKEMIVMDIKNKKKETPQIILNKLDHIVLGVVKSNTKIIITHYLSEQTLKYNDLKIKLISKKSTLINKMISEYIDEFQYPIKRLSEIVSEIEVFSYFANMAITEKLSIPVMSSNNEMMKIEDVFFLKLILPNSDKKIVKNSFSSKIDDTTIIKGFNSSGKSVFAQSICGISYMAQVRNVCSCIKSNYTNF